MEIIKEFSIIFLVIVVGVYNLLFAMIAVSNMNDKYKHPILNIPDVIRELLFNNERNTFGILVSGICVLFTIPGIILTIILNIFYLVYLVFVKIWELGNKKSIGEVLLKTKNNKV